MRTWANTHRNTGPVVRRATTGATEPPARSPWRDLLPPKSVPRPSTADGSALFRDEGEYWQIAFGGKCIGTRTRKGLFYLQHLLLHPEEKIHAHDLAVLADEYWYSPRPAPAGRKAGSDLSAEARRQSSDSGTILDSRATQEYKTRLRELATELDGASDSGDLERADAIRREIESITGELSAAFGRSRRARKMDDPMEKVRKAVTNRIHDSMERIAKLHPSLGRHLVNSIRTGFYCSYSPEQPIVWKS